MKTRIRYIKYSSLLALLLIVKISSFSQGRVVVNEFMSWSGCNTTSEFIELMNFGPGPMNIGCYIVTNGTYSATIPPNTIIQPGQYYVLSGQDIIAMNCGNTDSAIHVDLNWTTCNCTNQAVPTTGDGFLQNGGSANEKIILLDPNLRVVDAVSRSSTPSTSVPITSATVSGACTSKTFDLDTMSINYESINNSTGIDNSFARRVDGDCGWVKTTAISGHAPNKTGSTASASYNFSTLSASECNGSTGSISIAVSASNVASLFPMTYTLAFDKDSNNVFNDNDEYRFGIDSSASSIDISSLAYGRYRITVGSSLGCNLQSFDFFIFNCYGVVLSKQLSSFKYEGIKREQHLFKFRMTEIENVKSIVLEGSDGGNYEAVSTTYNRVASTTDEFTITARLSSYSNFRLKITSISNIVFYSHILNISFATTPMLKAWPNPVQDQLNFQIASKKTGAATYKIINSTGVIAASGRISLDAGTNTVSISAKSLPRGIYQLCATGSISENPVYIRFVKQ